MSSLLAYQLYNSLKLHFNNEKYSYATYGWNSNRFNMDTFRNRGDKPKFERLWNYYKSYEFADQKLLDILCTTFIYYPNYWIGDICENLDKLDAQAKNRNRYRLNHFEAFKKDLGPIISAIELSQSNNNSIRRYLETEIVIDGEIQYRIPPILDMIPQGSIQPETVVILDTIFPFLDKTGNNQILKIVAHRIKKYKTFMNIPDDEYQQITRYIKEHEVARQLT